MKRAGEHRDIENRDFQLAVEDQRATQKLLNAVPPARTGATRTRATFAKKCETDKVEFD